MTKLERISEILAVARKAIDEYEAKALKGEANLGDAAKLVGCLAVAAFDARTVAAYVEPKAGEAVEVVGTNWAVKR